MSRQVLPCTGFKISVATFMLLACIRCPTPAQEKRQDPEAARWQNMMPSIEEELTRHKTQCVRPWKASIVEAAQFPNGPSVALVDFCAGGASTDWLVPMHLKNGNPMLSRVRGRDGKIVDGGFVQGASVTHSDEVRLVPEKSAIYHLYYMENGVRLLSCGADVYLWDGGSGLFRWDGKLTRSESKRYCDAVASPPGK